MQKEDEKINERLLLLEMAVYKISTDGGKTKFDEIADKFTEIQTKA